MRRFLPFALVLALSPSMATAASVVITTGGSTIRQLLRYTDEIPSLAPSLLIDVNAPADAAVCRGGWINNTDAQYRDVLQMALAAKMAGLRIRLDGDPARLFSGSSDRYCYINLIVIE